MQSVSIEKKSEDRSLGLVSNHKIVIFTSLSLSQDQSEERSRENEDAKKPCADEQI